MIECMQTHVVRSLYWAKRWTEHSYVWLNICSYFFHPLIMSHIEVYRRTEKNYIINSRSLSTNFIEKWFNSIVFIQSPQNILFFVLKPHIFDSFECHSLKFQWLLLCALSINWNLKRTLWCISSFSSNDGMMSLVASLSKLQLIYQHFSLFSKLRVEIRVEVEKNACIFNYEYCSIWFMQRLVCHFFLQPKEEEYPRAANCRLYAYKPKLMQTLTHTHIHGTQHKCGGSSYWISVRHTESSFLII